METITKEFEVFEYNELSTKAQEKAYSEWLQGREWFWGNEAVSTMNKFADVFFLNIRNYTISDDYRSDISWNFTSAFSYDVQEFSGQRLGTFIWNNFRKEIYARKYYHNKPVGSEGYKSRYSNLQVFERGCSLNGFIYDVQILEPIWSFIDKPCENTDFEDLINQCFNSFLEFCKVDIEDCFSSERFEEECKDQELRFLESGEQFYN